MVLLNEGVDLIPLESGDELTRDEFERRYSSRPDIKKAELIEGVVYVGSPVRIRRHASPHGLVVTWLGTFSARTPGTLFADNGTVRLEDDTEVQPDAFLMWDEGHGGQSRLDDDEDADDYLEGAPELVVEVSASSASIDLHRKKEAYRRAGLREYLVWQILEKRLDWFRLTEGAYVPVEPGPSGTISSEVFPGLRLHVAALLRGDLGAVLATLG